MKILKWYILSETDLAVNQSDNWQAGYAQATGYYEIMLEKVKRDEFKKGRDFEFRTINDHMQGMFKGKMTDNVEWVVQRFRETMKNVF